MSYNTELLALVSTVLGTFLTLFSYMVRTSMRDLKHENRKITQAVETLRDTILEEQDTLNRIHGSLAMVLYELLRKGDIDKRTLESFKKLFFIGGINEDQKTNC